MLFAHLSAAHTLRHLHTRFLRAPAAARHAAPHAHAATARTAALPTRTRLPPRRLPLHALLPARLPHPRTHAFTCAHAARAHLSSSCCATPTAAALYCTLLHAHGVNMRARARHGRNSNIISNMRNFFSHRHHNDNEQRRKYHNNNISI